MAVISGYHVDDYCVEAFKDAVHTLQQRLGAVKITDFSSITPGILIAKIPPKILSFEEEKEAFRQIPVYQVAAVGDEFDANGGLISTGEADYLYFQASACYLLDLNREAPRFEKSQDSFFEMTSYFDARDLGQLKAKHEHLDEDLKGILYRIPDEQLVLADQ